MVVILIDILCVALFVTGIIVVLKGVRAARGQADDPPPVTYITRIAGTMMVIFALALGSMTTLFALLNN